MSVILIILIGVALSMDALGVTFSIGVLPNVNNKSKYIYIFSFGFFQFALMFLGGFIGNLFNMLISIPESLGGMVIGVIGIIMIIDAINKKENSILLKKSMNVFLGISVSIDAFVIGFTLMSNINLLCLFVNSILVGLITFMICYIGIIVCDYIKKIYFVEKYANFFGGIILIIMSLKMIFF